ncbi:class I SAM-dependent methyltransferase [Actinoplanes sp. L3-i22]|uniref:class I SAM-dependent methyltransferase n=1 Tax=Actinoplanes sp. L3-i22 TaxID=2836373 RepID=UPI001C743FE3|nr:class I SAM-dependent methyltransferase [Actinoplanes sp. L3-i22]BCY07995.1 methyltransferase type 11 [Actinoplanes sp. L3-i22]
MPTHHLRAAAESFGNDAARYDRTRPPYPVALLDRILAASPGRRVLTAGCGTGIESRQFRDLGCTVLGVEPDPRMAAFARATGIPVELAKLEDWEPAGRTFDLVTAGTAWHWIDPVAGARQAARVLVPGGRLAPLWHVFTPPDELTDTFGATFRRLVPDSPFDPGKRPAGSALDGYRPILTAAADGIRAAGGFAEPEEWHEAWEKAYTRDEYLDQMPTSGALTRLPAEQIAELQATVGAVIDRMGGGFTMRYVTVAVTAVRE